MKKMMLSEIDKAIRELNDVKNNLKTIKSFIDDFIEDSEQESEQEVEARVEVLQPEETKEKKSYSQKNSKHQAAKNEYHREHRKDARYRLKENVQNYIGLVRRVDVDVKKSWFELSYEQRRDVIDRFKEFKQVLSLIRANNVEIKDADVEKIKELIEEVK